MRTHRPLKYRFYSRTNQQMNPVIAIDFMQKIATTPFAMYHFSEGELMEFTTCRDIYDQDIYEDDLVEFKVAEKRIVGRIWWTGDAWQVGDYDGLPLSNFSCKVIGDIFRTPQFADRRFNYAGV